MGRAVRLGGFRARRDMEVPGRGQCSWETLRGVRSLDGELRPHPAPCKSDHLGPWAVGPPQQVSGISSGMPPGKGFVFLKGLPWVAASPGSLFQAGTQMQDRGSGWKSGQVFRKLASLCSIAATLCGSYILGLSNSSTKQQ